MTLDQTFEVIELDNLLSICAEYKGNGYRFAQVHAVLKEDDSITLIYTFVKGNEVRNLKILGVIKGETEVPSVTGMFLQAFVYENEAKELFGVNIKDIAIDFENNFYTFAPGVDAPMTIITPAQLAARQKAARLKAAKEAKAKAAAAKAKASASDDDLEAEIAAKTAGLDPEKAAKVRAAMIAKAKKNQAKAKEDSLEAEIEAKTAGLDPDKAAKVRAAMEAKAAREAKKAAEGKEE